MRGESFVLEGTLTSHVETSKPKRTGRHFMSHAGGNGEKLVKKSAGGLGRVAEDHVSAVVLAGRHMKAKLLTLFIVPFKAQTLS